MSRQEPAGNREFCPSAISITRHLKKMLVVPPGRVLVTRALGRPCGAEVSVESIGKRLDRFLVLVERLSGPIEIHEKVAQLLARGQDLPRRDRMGSRLVLERSRFAEKLLTLLRPALGAGGDTDSQAAILGAWLGARHGEPGLPAHLIAELSDGPFGPTHLRGLAAALAGGAPPPRYSWLRALLRNLALYPVVIFHGLRRIFP